MENGSKIIGIYGGGFKPPTKGHFEVVQQALKQFPEMDELLIYVGSGERDKIDQAESVLVWDIYQKHLPSKVSIEAVKSPIGDIFKYAKDHPEEKIYFILGAREGSESDQADISSRTKSVKEKYPNIEVKIISTSDANVSGTNARKALFQSRDEFFKYIPSVLSPVEKERVYTLLVPELISENASYAKDIDYKQYIKELTKDMIRKGMNVTPLPKVIFKHSDVSNAKDFFGKTAYYEPQSMSIVLYTEGRHPKDIVRSFAHEMIHHMQNVEDRLGDITTTNTQEDDRLNDLEAEANLKGTMTFRNWTDKMQERKNKDPFGITAYALELARGLQEQEDPKYKIYVDMDGVVADFDKRFTDLAGMGPREFEEKYGKNAFWDFIDEGDNKLVFWVGIPPMPDAQQLMNFVSNYDYEMLTAPSLKKQSVMGKGLWMKNQTNKGLFPFKPKVNYKKAQNKKDLAAPNHILIDDREDNINSWIASGGIGILHTSASSTINQLKKLGL